MNEVAGKEFTDMGRVTVLPTQPFESVSVTVIVPPALPQSTEMALVPCPETMVAPAGTVQAYEDPLVLMTE